MQTKEDMCYKSRDGEHFSLVVGLQTGTATVEISMKDPWKTDLTKIQVYHPLAYT